MISKPSRLAFSGMVLVCAVILAACCSSGPRLQFVTVAPISGEIYVSGGGGAGVKGALRHAPRPALQQPRGTTGKRPAITIQPVTATCGSLQYAATALFSDGSTKDASSTATWTSSNTSVAVVSTTGLASGIGLGTANIGATLVEFPPKASPWRWISSIPSPFLHWLLPCRSARVSPLWLTATSPSPPAAPETSTSPAR